VSLVSCRRLNSRGVEQWLQCRLDVKKGLHSLYVYCPLVEPRMVGDAQVPLLRIVPAERRDGEMITRVFNPKQYFPDTAKSMSSLISSPHKYRNSFSGLVYVIIVVSFRIVAMSWFHSTDNSFRFLQKRTWTWQYLWRTP
jgi:hypothetical protein